MRALRQPHHAKKIVRLLPRQRNRLPRPKRVIYIQPDFCARHERQSMTVTGNTPETEGQVSDAVTGNWVDRLAPVWSRPYLRLSRADRPIGTWLLLLPCWWGAFLAAASQGAFGLREAWVLVGCGIGAWLMRGAGCTWNDITDRNFDATVARTRSRPIPSGQVSVRQAGVWLALQALVAFAILLTFHITAIMLGVSLAGAGGDLPVRQAVHLVAAGVSGAGVQLGCAIGLGGGDGQPRLATGGPCIFPASPGRCSTTRSMRIRTRRTTR